MDEALLVQEYRPRLLYFVLKQVRDRALAEEITQETLLVVVQSQREKRIHDESKIGSYAFGVAKNLIFKHRGMQARNEEAMAEFGNVTVPWIDHPEAEILLQQRRDELQRAFDQLGSEDKEILNRSIVADDRLQDIARDLEIPYAAARKRKSRALDRLRKLFWRVSQKEHS